MAKKNLNFKLGHYQIFETTNAPVHLDTIFGYHSLSSMEWRRGSGRAREIFFSGARVSHPQQVRQTEQRQNYRNRRMKQPKLINGNASHGFHGLTRIVVRLSRFVKIRAIRVKCFFPLCALTHASVTIKTSSAFPVPSPAFQCRRVWPWSWRSNQNLRSRTTP